MPDRSPWIVKGAGCREGAQHLGVPVGKRSGEVEDPLQRVSKHAAWQPIGEGAHELMLSAVAVLVFVNDDAGVGRTQDRVERS